MQNPSKIKLHCNWIHQNIIRKNSKYLSLNQVQTKKFLVLFLIVWKKSDRSLACCFEFSQIKNSEKKMMQEKIKTQIFEEESEISISLKEEVILNQQKNSISFLEKFLRKKIRVFKDILQKLKLFSDVKQFLLQIQQKNCNSDSQYLRLSVIYLFFIIIFYFFYFYIL